MAHYISDFSLLHLVDFYAVWPDAGIKINPSFPVRAQTVTKVIFYYIVTKCFKIAQKASKYLDHVDEKICCQELSKIAQSGHTAFTHTKLYVARMNTCFCEIDNHFLPVWPYWAKFRHFGNIFKVFGICTRVYFVLHKISKLLWQFACNWEIFHCH